MISIKRQREAEADGHEARKRTSAAVRFDEKRAA